MANLEKGIGVKSWISFIDCIELHKLTVFPADAVGRKVPKNSTL
jgi:hypothetical protein